MIALGWAPFAISIESHGPPSRPPRKGLSAHPRPVNAAEREPGMLAATTAAEIPRNESERAGDAWSVGRAGWGVCPRP